VGRPTLTTLRRVGLMAESFLPLLPRSTGAPARAADGVELTVLAANLELGQRDARALARAIAAIDDADVLLLCEHSPATRAALTAAGIDERWPHQADDPSEGFFGSLIASRHPLVAVERRDLGGRIGQVADVAVAGTTVRVVPVHTQAPVFDHDVEVWHGTVAANAAVADEVDGPVVLAGDWNATGGHRAFRRALARHHLVDVSAVQGHRWYPTWPIRSLAIRWPLPPLLTLDHVVVRRDVEIVALARIDLPGTDHRALRATLRLPRA
jgi:endonuclease/exonuclease/phosphatase (EEP) superfamily protein YafD